VLHVFDTGQGFEYRPRLPSDLLSERGRGLFLVAALAEEVSAELRRPSGSHVRVVLAARPRMRALSTLARDALV
jgi:anti-sigma regulatory factor (Ser/Thr protein kinase)